MGSVRAVIGRLIVLVVAALLLVVPPAAEAQQGCPQSSGFTGVSPAGAGPRAVRVTFGRRETLPVDVDVFAVSRGRRVVAQRRVARFAGRTDNFVWDGRDTAGHVVPEGFYVMRFTMRREERVVDSRRVALVKRRTGFVRGPVFERVPECDLLTTYRLERPVFGGTRDTPLGLTIRLERDARVQFTITRVGGQVVSRQDPVPSSARQTYRITLAAGELRPGDYRVRLVAVSGSDRVVETLTAHRL